MDSLSALNFRNLLHDFVNNSISAKGVASHKELEQAIDNLTKTRECWELDIQVLLPETDPNVLSIASSILKNKLQYDFGQLTPELFSQVHAAIFEIIAKHQKPSNALRNNLAICIALIYIHKALEIGELLDYLSKCFSQGQNRNYIYTVLEVLPEEVDNEKVVVEEEKRQHLRQYMKTIQKYVLVELNNVAASCWKDNTVKKTVLLRCFSNWIRIDEDKEVLKSLPQHILLTVSFEGLSDSDISGECADCIKQTIKSIENPQQNPQLYKYLAQRVLGFFEIVRGMVEQQEFELCEDYVEILCTFGRASKEEFVKNPSQDYKSYLDNMIFLTSESQLDCQDCLNKFWDRFLTELTSSQQSALEYKTQLQQLYTVLCQTTRYSLYECQELNERTTQQLENVNKEFEQKLSNRDDVVKLVDLLVATLGPMECLSLSLNFMNQLDTSDSHFWPQLQCYLSPLTEITESLTESSPTLDELVRKVLQIRPPFVVVQKTFIRLLSSCSLLYSKDTEFAQKIFYFLVEQLKSKDTASTASRAFENVCTNNVDFVLSNIDSFLPILQAYQHNDKILKGIVKALSNNIPLLNKHLPQVFMLYLQEMTVSTDIKSAKLVLQKFVSIFHQITREDPSGYADTVGQMFGQLWPLIKPILERQCTNSEEESLLEKCTKVIKYALRCLKQHFHPFMDQVYLTTLEGYRKYPISSYVYMVEILVTVFYNTPQFHSPINSLFESVCEITFNHLSRMEDLMQNPDLASDFFGMLSRFMRFMPQIINNCNHIDLLLNFLIDSCGIEDGQTARAYYAFVEDLYMQYWDISLVQQHIKEEKPNDPIITERTPEMISSSLKARPLILPKTPTLLQKVIQHLSSVPSSSVRHCIESALLSSMKGFPFENREIWIQVMTPIEADILTAPQKNKIVDSCGNLNPKNLEYLESMLHLMSKRYMHRLTRSAT